MNEKPTFRSLEKFSNTVEDNEFFIQFSNPDLPFIKKVNSTSLKYSPTLGEFKIIEEIIHEHQTSLKQNYVKFYWPENIGIRIDVLDYINQTGYSLGKSLLMMAEPKNLSLNTNNEINIEEVTPNNLHLFMDINRQEDLNINAKYAEHFEAYYRYQLQSDKVTGYLAYLNENVVGSMLLISTDNFLEIDNLLTVSEFRKTGVASTLINHVKKLGLTENKRIILTADAEDYPKDIYLKMGFNILSSQIEIQKDLVL